MADDDECIHGLGPVSACVLCNGRAQREAADEVERHRTREPGTHVFSAKFPGFCVPCQTPTEPGERIVLTVGGSYAHVRCTTTPSDEIGPSDGVS